MEKKTRPQGVKSSTKTRELYIDDKLREGLPVMCAAEKGKD